jgi:hypothetical protein
LLTELGLENQPDEHFAKMLKTYGLYERPVMDSKGNIITHYAEVMAARKNGVTTMDVYVIDMADAELRLFIFLKHKYHVKSQVSSYNAAKFFRNYLRNNIAGKKLLAGNKGDINDKIGELMQTSGSTIKRLLRIGDKRPEFLGRIDEGNMSFHEATSSIRVERLTKTYKQRKEEGQGKNSIKGNQKNRPKEDRILANSIHQVCYGKKLISFGHEKSKPFIKVGDKVLPKVTFEEYNQKETNDHGVIKTLVFQQEIKKGISISIKFENISNAA